MRMGIHLPNARIGEDDFCRFRIVGFESARLMWYHTQAEVARLQLLGCTHFEVRLPDSTVEGRWKGDVEWADECIAIIKKFAPLGILDFSLDCEPNMQWEVKDAPTWRWLANRVVYRIRQSPHVPANVRLGLAPLAWTSKTWAGVEKAWIPQQKLIVDKFQYICVNSYWEESATYNHPPTGGNVTHWHDQLMRGVDLPYVVTEWASTSQAPDIEARRMREYPMWLRWIATKPYVEGTYLWILGGTPDWKAHFPTDKVLRAIGTVIDTWQ